MKVSIVVPAYNEEKYIRPCIEALLAQTDPADEIIIVDNNSTDKTCAIVSEYPVTLVHEKKQGISYSRNCGFNTAKFDIIARTDADTIIPPTWIQQIKKHFEDPDVVGVSGDVHYAEIPETVHDFITTAFKTLRGVLGHDVLIGPNFAIRKSAWEKIKTNVCMKDTEVHEDIDLSIHLSLVGKIIADKTIIVESSSRRFKKASAYFDYPYRTVNSIRKHRNTVLHKRGKAFMKKVLKKANEQTSHFHM